jgi:hypothetical protein
MPYIDGKLASGERVLRREHQHWFVLVADARYGILAIAAAILLLILRAAARTSGDFDRVIGFVVLALVLGGLVYLGWQILRWVNEEFVVTTRRVLQMEGVLNKQLVDSSLEKINDAVLTQSIFGRIFGFGDLDILTASESGISRLRMLKDADGFKRAMLDAKHEYERDLAGPGFAGSPPLRSEPPPPPLAPQGIVTDDTVSTAVPTPAPTPAPGERLTRDEVTRTLNSLADLRDRGAISDDEFERKKADLLGRL